MRETDPLLGHTNGHAQDGEELSSAWSRAQQYLGQTVDAGKCYPALTVQCFIAGAADAAAYGYTKTWVGFMVSVDMAALPETIKSSTFFLNLFRRETLPN